MTKRKQLNIGLDQEDYDRIKAAADEEHLTVTAYCRRAILDAVDPPELSESQGADGIPAWLLSVLLFFAGRANKRHSKE